MLRSCLTAAPFVAVGKMGSWGTVVGRNVCEVGFSVESLTVAQGNSNCTVDGFKENFKVLFRLKGFRSTQRLVWHFGLSGKELNVDVICSWICSWV